MNSTVVVLLILVSTMTTALPVRCELSTLAPFTAAQLDEYVDIWFHSKGETTQKEKVKRMVELQRGMSQEQLEHISKLRNALVANKDCIGVDREKTM